MTSKRNKEKTLQVLTEVSPSFSFPEVPAPYWESNAAVASDGIARHDLETKRIARLELTRVIILVELYFLEVEKGPWERGWRPLYALTLAHKGQLRSCYK